MIVNWFLDILKTIISWILGILPHLDPPGWLSDAAGAIGTVTASLGAVSNWVPWTFVLGGVALVMAAYAVAVSIRGFRIVASFLTLGGGS